MCLLSGCYSEEEGREEPMVWLGHLSPPDCSSLDSILVQAMPLQGPDHCSSLFLAELIDSVCTSPKPSIKNKMAYLKDSLPWFSLFGC